MRKKERRTSVSTPCSQEDMHKINNVLRQHTTTTELQSVHTVYVETDFAQISLQGSH